MWAQPNELARGSKAAKRYFRLLGYPNSSVYPGREQNTRLVLRRSPDFYAEDEIERYSGEFFLERWRFGN